MNSENNRESYLHRLLLNVIDNINLRTKDEYIGLSNLSIYYAWKKNKKVI